jgi:CheY-like chemotaxis protein
VIDDGMGIEAGVLPHVFELFTKGRVDRHRLQDGLGIGLALVKQLVELHGGRVEVGSEGRGQGAEFVVRLPLADERAASRADAAGESTDPHATEPDEGALRVLIVDDNIDAARTLGLMVDLLGMEQRIANDGPSALAMAPAFMPHVALLDIGMPGMDGYELAHRFRNDPRHAEMVLVAVTGWAGAQDRQQARNAGFVDHFRKPADITRLSALLEATRTRLRRQMDERHPATGTG